MPYFYALFQNQWTVNGGKCGLCGDPYQGPRRHEEGYTGPGEHYANGNYHQLCKNLNADS